MPAKESSTSSENVSVEEYEKIRAKVRDLVSKKKATDKALVCFLLLENISQKHIMFFSVYD